MTEIFNAVGRMAAHINFRKYALGLRIVFFFRQDKSFVLAPCNSTILLLSSIKLKFGNENVSKMGLPAFAKILIDKELWTGISCVE